MTTDKIKADMLALEQADQARLDAQKILDADILDELTALEPKPSDPPPAEDPPPADDPPPVEDPPPSDPVDPVDPPSVDPPAPVIADPSITFAVVQQGKPLPAGVNGSNAKTITIPDNVGKIYCWKMTSLGTPVAVDADHLKLTWSHGDGQNFTYHRLATVTFVADPTNPSAPPATTPPTGGGTTTTPPATVPTTQVIPQISMPPAGVSVAPENLSVVITPADSTVPPVTLSGANATAYRDIKVAFAGIVQKHSREVSADGLWSVRFMPDADGKRIEISWQYGNADIPNPNDFGPYTIEFFAGTNSLGSYALTPGELWDAEPRVATADRPDALTREQVFAKKWLPIYGVTPVSQKSRPAAAKQYFLGGVSNVTVYMGQTGGRPDIGYIHEYAACFYATGDATARWSMRNWAEASCTGPWHLYDNKGRMFDFQKNPTATTYHGASATPPIYQGPKDPLFAATQFLPDDPHMPDLSFPEFILTGDPKHARELMNQANYYLGGEHGDGSDVHAALMKIYGPKTFEVESSQERGSAWMLRLFFQAYIVSTLIDDETLLPTSFWKMVMDHNRDIFISLFVNNTTEARCSIFKAFPVANIFSSWQQDFMYGVLGALQQSGLFPDWQPIYDFCESALLARRDPANGDKRVPSWYYACGAFPSFTPDAANTGTLSLDAFKFNGWATTAKGSYLEFGDWNFLMVDDTNFTLTHASGDRVLKGAVGTMFGGTDIGKNPGMNFTISGTPKAGDKGVVNIRDFTSWKEFFDTNNFDPHWTTWSDYIGDYRWALANFAPNYPAIAAILPGLETEMQDNKLQIDWKYSTLPMAA